MSNKKYRDKDGRVWTQDQLQQNQLRACDACFYDGEGDDPSCDPMPCSACPFDTVSTFIAASELTEVKEERKFGIGSHFTLNNERYILAQVNWEEYTLINLSEGQRWCSPIRMSPGPWTWEHLDKTFCNSPYYNLEVIDE